MVCFLIWLLKDQIHETKPLISITVFTLVVLWWTLGMFNKNKPRDQWASDKNRLLRPTLFSIYNRPCDQWSFRWFLWVFFWSTELQWLPLVFLILSQEPSELSPHQMDRFTVPCYAKTARISIILVLESVHTAAFSMLNFPTFSCYILMYNFDILCQH